jgi:drug/metabolite transporter, DME family
VEMGYRARSAAMRDAKRPRVDCATQASGLGGREPLPHETHDGIGGAAMHYRTGVICVLAAGALWSLMGLFLRQIESPSTWAILFWRSVGTIPVLLIFIGWRAGGNPFPVIRSVGFAGVIGGLCLVAAFAGAIYSIQSTTVANAVFLFTASPFVAALFGWLILRERVRPATWAAMALAVVGMFIMVREGLAVGALSGNIAAILSAAGFGGFAVALRWGRVADATPIALLGAVFAAIAAGVVLLVQGVSPFISASDTGLSLFLGAGILATGMILFTLGARVLPAAEATLLSLIEVMLAPIWVWLFLRETASVGTFVGGAILLVAVMMNAVAGARGQATQGVAQVP